MTSTETNRVKGRLTLVALALAFILPMAVAYLWRPSGEAGNYGSLIEPPRPLAQFEMTDLDGNAAGIDTLREKWTLLYVGGEQCLAQCRSNLFKIERVRLTQGKNIKRVQSLYLAPGTTDARAVEDTLVEYAGVRGYRITRDQLDAMAPGFKWGTSGQEEASDRIYLVDPLGNLMMSYPGDADPTGMKKDLQRLLKVSQIG